MRISRLALPVPAASLAVIATGCSGLSPDDGTITGHLIGAGGPAPGLVEPWPGTVTVTGHGFRRSVTAGADGSYSIALPAGRYALTGRSPRYNSGAGLCEAGRFTSVTPGHTTKADVVCSMK